MKTKIRLQFVEFPFSKVRIKCKKHGLVPIKPAYDYILKAMTGGSCAKCPTITANYYLKHSKDTK